MQVLLHSFARAVNCTSPNRSLSRRRRRGWLRPRRETAERIEAEAEAVMRNMPSVPMPKLGDGSARW